jgi:sarcosine oxidase, subunit alpha
MSIGSLEFEGARVALHHGDTVGSALHRAGVRTLTRSLKYHRRRGLYCMSGDCPNCSVTVDGVPGCRACMTPAHDGQVVRRDRGLPSADLDLLHAADFAHALLPVGFYYKTFIRPRFAWSVAERIIRRSTGVGRLPVDREPSPEPSRHMRCDVLVVGGGLAGLAAARAASRGGGRVVVCDEGVIGERIGQPDIRRRLRELVDELPDNVQLLEHHTAVGIYEGPLVPLVGPSEMVRVEPQRVVVATGAVETHPVFPGNDLPGVFLGRGATRLAGVHGVLPGTRSVLVAATREGVEQASMLQAAGVTVVAALVNRDLADTVPGSIEVLEGGRVAAAHGSKQIVGVTVVAGGPRRRLDCDALVVSLGYSPRDALLLMGAGLPVRGAGDVVRPGCSPEEAVLSGARAGTDDEVDARAPHVPELGTAGVVCLCEDVDVEDLERAWCEGWRSTEILKRYTTATMGPCQGALCGRHVTAFVSAKLGSPSVPAAVRTSARPPVRPVRLWDLAGGVYHATDRRTALHDRHVSAGARMERSSGWLRPFTYGDAAGEYEAVREGVSLMDVGTLGKFLIGGADAVELIDRVFACRVRDLVPGRARYLLALDEGGYVIDDGLLDALAGGRFYVTSTSGGADRMEAWLRNWADRYGLRAHVLNHTALLGAINVAGPFARELLERLWEGASGPGSIAYPGHADATVAGVPCTVLSVGFVGETSFELHHPRSRGVELWDALLRAGDDLGVRPHGLDALDVLRVEKAHVYIGQDTLPDDHPEKLGLGFAVAMEKGPFVGRGALARMADLPLERKLVGLSFDGTPQRGMPLRHGGRVVGRITSSAWSPACGRAIGLGWVRAVDGTFPSSLRAGDAAVTVVPTPFYDPDGARLHA